MEKTVIIGTNDKIIEQYNQLQHAFILLWGAFCSSNGEHEDHAVLNVHRAFMQTLRLALFSVETYDSPCVSDYYAKYLYDAEEISLQEEAAIQQYGFCCAAVSIYDFLREASLLEISMNKLLHDDGTITHRVFSDSVRTFLESHRDATLWMCTEKLPEDNKDDYDLVRIEMEADLPLKTDGISLYPEVHNYYGASLLWDWSLLWTLWLSILERKCPRMMPHGICGVALTLFVQKYIKRVLVNIDEILKEQKRVSILHIYK
jgi:hypothetical protein